MTSKQDFHKELTAQIVRAHRQGRPHIEINAGELHRVVGGYPNNGAHGMPSCCSAMRDEYQQGRAEIIHDLESGQGAALTIRYLLPR